MAVFVPNRAGLNYVKHGHGGPVYRHVEAAQRATVINARAKAPKDTGILAASIRAGQPQIVGESLVGRVSAHAISRNGEDYAYLVHQGRGAIRPRTASSLRFYWKRVGKKVETDYVRPRRGRPFLADALRVVSNVLGFKFKPGKPPRNNGS